eukprot:1836419-Amphidinium_carterae.1
MREHCCAVTRLSFVAPHKHRGPSSDGGAGCIFGGGGGGAGAGIGWPRICTGCYPSGSRRV